MPLQLKYRRKNQRGMSLIELIISASISLAIIAAVIHIYGESLYTQQFNITMNQMNMKGTETLEQLSHIIEHAGYSPVIKTTQSASFSYPATGQFATNETIIIAQDDTHSRLHLRIAYDDRTPIQDCLARNIPQGSESHITLYLDHDTLMCESTFYDNGIASHKKSTPLQTQVTAFYAHALVTLSDGRHQILSTTTNHANTISKINAIHLELILKSEHATTANTHLKSNTMITTYNGPYTTQDTALHRQYSRLSSIPNG